MISGVEDMRLMNKVMKERFKFYYLFEVVSIMLISLWVLLFFSCLVT